MNKILLKTIPSNITQTSRVPINKGFSQNHLGTASGLLLSICALSLGLLCFSPNARAESVEDLFSITEEKTKLAEQTPTAIPAFDAQAAIEFTPLRAGSNRWGVDPKTIAIGSDAVVRYVVISQSPSGTVNAFYEGIRCDEGENKVYARYSGDSWTEVKTPEWKPIASIAGSRHAHTLFKIGFCEGFTTPLSERDIVRNLKNGGRSGFAGFSRK